jgi:hypothetical protein
MNHYCTVYRKDTGLIVQYSEFYCQEDEEFVQKNFDIRVQMFGADEHAYIATPADPAAHYVITLDEQAFLVDRPPLIVQTDKISLTADGIDSITLTGLPDPCDIIIDAPDPDVETTVTEVTGGGFIFIADDPGIYTVEVVRWPFVPFKIEFTAT